MINNHPTVSIIIPTYNRWKLLQETLLSVINQSFENWECIIIDDGSVDDTQEMIEKYCRKDKRFKYFARPKTFPKGASGCRNYGMQKSVGEYIQWLDDDDLLSHKKLEFQVSRLREVNDPLIFSISPWDFYWYGKKIELSNSFSKKDLYSPEEVFNILGKDKTFIPLHSYLIPRTLAIKTGEWNNFLEINQDAEYLTRVLVASKVMVNTPGCYVLYREHSGKRISREENGRAEAILFSLSLMQAFLRIKGIECKDYFRWKLLKIFNFHWVQDRHVIKKYSCFFKENGIYLEFALYYKAKYSFYVRFYPLYKRFFKK